VRAPMRAMAARPSSTASRVWSLLDFLNPGLLGRASVLPPCVNSRHGAGQAPEPAVRRRRRWMAPRSATHRLPGDIVDRAALRRLARAARARAARPSSRRTSLHPGASGTTEQTLGGSSARSGHATTNA
jgi:hypothetical protein